MNSRPGSSAKASNGLVGDVAAQLADGRLRVGEVPEHDADEHGAADRMLRTVISGAFAAALTPLRDCGAALDEAAFEPYVDSSPTAAWTASSRAARRGRGCCSRVDERRRARALPRGRGRSRPVAVHCGAQTTADTAALAAHAAEAGAAAVAVIAPPFFPLDERALEAHLVAAAAACAPLPFYVYEFAARSGYAVRSRWSSGCASGSESAWAKVSDKPWEKVEPYLLDGLDVFIGAEALVARGWPRARPEPCPGSPRSTPRSWRRSSASRRRALVRGRTARGALDRFPFQAAAKVVAARRGCRSAATCGAAARVDRRRAAELALP